jgi:hypothetical protein
VRVRSWEYRDILRNFRRSLVFEMQSRHQKGEKCRFGQLESVQQWRYSKAIWTYSSDTSEICDRSLALLRVWISETI